MALGHSAPDALLVLNTATGNEAGTPEGCETVPPTKSTTFSSGSVLVRDLVATKYRTGYRDGIAHGVVSKIDDPVEKVRVRFAILSATTDAEAVQIGREALRREAVRLEGELAPLESNMDRLKRVKTMCDDVLAWLNHPLKLGAADASMFHRITAQNTLLVTVEPCPLPPEVAAAQAGNAAGVFLVQHDWGALLASADVDDGAVRLPFDYCCFEVELSGRRVCALVVCNQGEPKRLIPIVRAKGGWLILRSYALGGTEPVPEGADCTGDAPTLAKVLLAQIRAIAITLDAEVVTSEAVRAPHQLNAARLKRGEQPLFDHHVLRLVHRSRAERLPSSGATGSKRRLHFRRGHWRHYPNHKTWIKWMLVGDASLGFADKDYRL